jgi:restriction system protein
MPEQVLRPPFAEVMWATLQAIRELGGSGANREIARKALEIGNFTDDQRAVLHRGVGPETEIEYRVAWARTYLKGAGALVNSGRGVWSLTEIGRSLTETDVAEVPAEYNRRRRAERVSDPAALEEDAAAFDEGDWKSELLEGLLAMSPGGFERLNKRLLREAGFSSVEVTGRSGDGGIDGTGLYSPSTPSLISFPVVFQCKRYQGSVGPSSVRDLRGAMSGRGERGIFVTTGSFTRDAQTETTRDGVPVIELVGGDRLCELLKELALGIEVETVERVSVVPEFFAEI